ncbi:MAG: hypothetical protein DHS20C18_21520 [Saprospiraceae bacterium]|nr:MAG: hypothetical protein DHS20C18_21520 [Saprospiraceae bacterium]
MKSETLMNHLVTNQVNADWMDGRARISYNDGNFSISLSSTIKMRKDSLIWMNAKKLGLEVARVMVTPDSVYVLNRLNREYSIKGLESLQKDFNLPGDFTTLQQVILGNPIFFFSGNMQVETNNIAYHLYGKSGEKESHYYMDNPALLLRKMAFKDGIANRNMDLILDEYGKSDDQQDFSYLRNVLVDSRETGKAEVEIKFTKVSLNKPTDIQFEIPDRYTRVD